MVAAEVTISGGREFRCNIEEGRLTIRGAAAPDWCKVPTVQDSRVPIGMAVFCRGGSPILVRLTQEAVEPLVSAKPRYLGVVRRDWEGRYFIVKAGLPEPAGTDVAEFTATIWAKDAVMFFRDEDEARSAMALLGRGIVPAYTVVGDTAEFDEESDNDGWD